ncbi:PilW family protein [Aeromonas sp. 164P]
MARLPEKPQIRPARGFTLIELVMVMVLLGIMATLSSQFIGQGVLLYRDGALREQLMSDARFALERLSRELRDAVPGSERIEDLHGVPSESGACLRFYSIQAATRYLTLAESEGQILTPYDPLNPLEFDPRAVEPGDWLLIYPTPASDPAIPLLTHCVDGQRCATRISAVTSLSAGVLRLDYAQPPQTSSPAKRAYITRQQLRYCVIDGRLWRARGELKDEAAQDWGPEVLMAEGLAEGAFYREPEAFSGESLIGLHLTLTHGEESVRLNHKIGVLNVP